MTIFWLYNLQVAILNCKSDKKLEKLPTRDMFDDVLLHSPYLMYGGLWKDFYTKDLMMSPEAKQYWRLPDLQPLPDFAERTKTDRRRVRRLSQEEPFRLMRFAFAVVQKYMSSEVKRGWLVKQSLAALQTTTMRIRAQNPDMRPYSETQAYFWIQIVHAALSGWQEAATKSDGANMAVERMSFSSFRVLFDMDPSVWRRYYTPNRWDSVEARLSFVLPELQPLPNIISLPSSEKFMLAAAKQAETAGVGTAAEIPSMEELAMNANILLGELADNQERQTASSKDNTHAHMLRFLFDRLVPKDGEVTPASMATAAMMDISSTDVLTVKAFWVQQVLTAVTRMDMKTTFEDFIRGNLHLVYQDLPQCYFSTELLQSIDAKEKIMAPDKRKLNGFLPVTGSDLAEGEWVVM
jgi:ubiquitin carboxyl-terminal hydrolase L3